MVEISKSESGEGFGSESYRGYSTGRIWITYLPLFS
jgi:hypothetical protein